MLKKKFFLLPLPFSNLQVLFRRLNPSPFSSSFVPQVAASHAPSTLQSPPFPNCSFGSSSRLVLAGEWGGGRGSCWPEVSG